MSLLMEALRKAEEANKNSSSQDNVLSQPQSDEAAAPEVDEHASVTARGESETVPDAAERTAPVSATELADLLDQSDLEAAAPRETAPATPTATAATTTTPGPLSALRMSLALEPLAQAPGTPSLAAALDAVALSDHVPEDAMSDNEPASPSQPDPTLEQASTTVEMPAAAPAPTSGMQDDILAEFDQEFAALVKKIEQEEAASTPAPTAAPVAAPVAAPAAAAPIVAAVATKPAALASTTGAGKPSDSRPASNTTMAPASKAAGMFAARGALLKGRTAKIAFAGAAAMVVFLGGGGYYVYTESMRLSQPMAFLPAAMPALAEDTAEPSVADESPAAATDTAATPVLAEAHSIALAAPLTEVIAKTNKQAVASAATTAIANMPDTMVMPTSQTRTESAPQAATAARTQPAASAESIVASAPPTTPANTPVTISAPHAAVVAPGTNNVTVTRETHTPSQYQQRFATAFQAYQRGDVAAAAAAYEQALAFEPLSRDAMLGLAASVMRLGETQRARELYEQALRVAPNDAQATAGLLNLLSESEPLRAESEIKFLLRQSPNVADLHFALGNVYIKQSKWGDAQQAFATAATLDPSNADYMFNLAVSHDQMGNRNKALDAYRTAQQLAAVKRAGFDPLAIAARIRELSGAPAQAEGS